MTDAMAALVDVRVRPPRQGDSDEGRVVLLDAPEHNRWPALLSLGDALFGRLDWWPLGARTREARWSARLLGARRAGQRPTRDAARDRFADAGITILRTDDRRDSPEIWCRCDGGPHGFLSIAAHAHADALSVEVRYDGVDILADPGTYCYHGEPEWRNVLPVDDRAQHGGDRRAVAVDPRRPVPVAAARADAEIAVTDDGTVATWSG